LFINIRYRTRDISALSYDKCECGCPYVRIKRIYGRDDDMMIIKGVNVYPIQIEKILLSFDDLSHNYMLTLETRDNGGASFWYTIK
jgi:phenylacetate-CoA ligase